MPFPAFSEGRKESAVVSCFFYPFLASSNNKRMKETVKKRHQYSAKNYPDLLKKNFFREKIPDFSSTHERMCVYRRYAPEDGHLSKTNKTHSADLKGVCPGES